MKDYLLALRKLLSKEKVVLKSIKKETETIRNKKIESIKISGTYESKEFSKNDLLSKIATLENVTEIIDES